MMSQHFPVLQVLVPLLAGPLCVLLRSATGAWLVFAAASWIATALAAALLFGVLASGPISYALGGWPAPFGIVYAIDAANALVLLLVSLIAAAVSVYAREPVAREIPAERAYLFYACLCLCLAGLLGIVATGDAFNVFVFLEISSLSGYTLIALGRRRQALLAAMQYLIMGTVGGTFLLIGIGLAYALTGTLNMADMAVRHGRENGWDLVVCVTDLPLWDALFGTFHNPRRRDFRCGFGPDSEQWLGSMLLGMDRTTPRRAAEVKSLRP